jgi:Na+(H+)/acetate symporter ActP
MGGPPHGHRDGLFTAKQTFSAAQNGFALAGDWCSAAAFLGFSGLTALYRMDGALYVLGPRVAFCTVLFIGGSRIGRARDLVLYKLGLGCSCAKADPP